MEAARSQLEKPRSQLRGLGLDRMATDPAVTPLKLAGRAIEPAKRASDTVGRASEPAWMVPLHRSLSPTEPLPKNNNNNQLRGPWSQLRGPWSQLGGLEPLGRISWELGGTETERETERTERFQYVVVP